MMLRVGVVAIWVLLSACAGTPRTNTDLLEAIAWYTGASGQVDDERARLLLEQAAAEDDTLAVMWMARVHSTGRMGYPRDRALANGIALPVIDAVERLALAGNDEAAFLMGTAFAEGLGKTIDPVAAARWYERAARAGNILAQHNMGNIHAAGTGVEQDDAQAVIWWLQAARQGDAIPQFRLGEMYEHGRGVDAHREQALAWYREAARRGYQPARAASARLTR